MTNEEAVKAIKSHCYFANLVPVGKEALDMAIKALERESQTFEWCTDCREYDQEKHCCHRWSKVIRNTVEEMKQPKMGHWITKPHIYGVVFCSECDFELKIDNTNYCPNCGSYNGGN